MKAIQAIFIAAALLAIAMNAETTTQTHTETESADYIARSEIRFCEARGYDPDSMTAEQYDEFNDCWRGSIEEEAAMIDD